MRTTKLTQILPLMLSAVAALPAQPMIKNIVPERAIAGFGQTVTIQGFGLSPTNSPKVTFISETGGPDLQCNFILPLGATDNELNVRLVNGCAVPAGSYQVVVTGNNGTSDKFAYTVTAAPATPVLRSVCVQTFNGCHSPATTSTWHGGQIRFSAYGIDTAGATIEFHRGNIMVPVAVTVFAPTGDGGVTCFVHVPAGAGAGDTLIGLRAKVGNKTSGLSNLMKIRVEAP